MQAKFFCKTGALAGSEYLIGDDSTVGRGPENAIVLASSSRYDGPPTNAVTPPADAYFRRTWRPERPCLDGVPLSGRARLRPSRGSTTALDS